MNVTSNPIFAETVAEEMMNSGFICYPDESLHRNPIQQVELSTEEEFRVPRFDDNPAPFPRRREIVIDVGWGRDFLTQMANDYMGWAMAQMSSAPYHFSPSPTHDPVALSVTHGPYRKIVVYPGPTAMNTGLRDCLGPQPRCDERHFSAARLPTPLSTRVFIRSAEHGRGRGGVRHYADDHMVSVVDHLETPLQDRQHPFTIIMDRLLEASVGNENLIVKTSAYTYILALAVARKFPAAYESWTLASAFACATADNERNVMHACAHPMEIHYDDRQRLHNADGPAIVWADGTEVYALQDISEPLVKKFVQDDRDGIVHIIGAGNLMHTNTELVNVLIREYGPERFMKTCGGVVLDQGDCGDLISPRAGSFRMLRVWNSTPEPDGSHKQYFLAVPPHMTTAAEAAAWTMGFEGDEYGLYNPEKET